jgi:hypothetical protein
VSLKRKKGFVMTVYYRTKDGQVMADIAYRIGRIAVQYESLDLPSEENFESTLYLTALQNLLTQCQELYKAMKSSDRKKECLAASVSDVPGLWGIRKEFITKYSFEDEKLTYDDFLRHTRNAMSHPTALDIESFTPSTGYSTQRDISKEISKYIFISSPDVRKNNRLKEFRSRKSIEDHQEKYLRNYKDIEIVEVIDRRTITYQLKKNGEPFLRICRIDLPVSALRSLVLGLSNYLAQPIQENWDGYEINELIDVA